MADNEQNIRAEIEKLRHDFEQDENYRRKLKSKKEREEVWRRMQENSATRKKLLEKLTRLASD